MNSVGLIRGAIQCPLNWPDPHYPLARYPAYCADRVIGDSVAWSPNLLHLQVACLSIGQYSTGESNLFGWLSNGAILREIKYNSNIFQYNSLFRWWNWLVGKSKSHELGIPTWDLFDPTGQSSETERNLRDRLIRLITMAGQKTREACS